MSRCHTKSKFCGFCKSAGKPHHVYSSHYPKSSPGKDGVVICPTILATVCGYCRKTGHTTKYCTVLKQKNIKRRKNATRGPVLKKQYRHTVSTKPVPKQTNNNQFFALEYDNKEEQFPLPSLTNATISNTVPQGAWSKGINDAVKEDRVFEKHQDCPTSDEEDVIIPLNENSYALKSDLEQAYEMLNSYKPKIINWADCLDSDSDSDSD